MEKTDKIVLFGGAGLVGQNLAVLLRERGFNRLAAVDKHPANTGILRGLHPGMEVVQADMAEPGAWEHACAGATAAVMLQAQIGGEDPEPFRRNNLVATERALAALQRHGVPYLVHVSSSVVNSMAQDLYVRTKQEQESLVDACGIPHCVLRPTLMFGPFDRKHLGWLSRFMRRVPVFPIPGSGRYMRQPLYVRDFCRIILSCLERGTGGTYDITGRERVDYVDIIRAIRRATGAKTPLLHIPYGAFWALLKAYALVRPDPPFTTKQLKALITPDEFALIPWWDIFGVPSTPFQRAVEETFGPEAQASPYGQVELAF